MCSWKCVSIIIWEGRGHHSSDTPPPSIIVPGIAVGLMTKRLLGALKSIILLCAGAEPLRVVKMGGESRHAALDRTKSWAGFHGVFMYIFFFGNLVCNVFGMCWMELGIF
jgi:hypothetical protein